MLMLQSKLGNAQKSIINIVVVLCGGFKIRNIALGGTPVFRFLLRNLWDDSKEIAEMYAPQKLIVQETDHSSASSILINLIPD